MQKDSILFNVDSDDITCVLSSLLYSNSCSDAEWFDSSPRPGLEVHLIDRFPQFVIESIPLLLEDCRSETSCERHDQKIVFTGLKTEIIS